MARIIICLTMLIAGIIIIKVDHDDNGGLLMPAWLLRLGVVAFLIGLAGTLANLLWILLGKFNEL